MRATYCRYVATAYKRTSRLTVNHLLDGILVIFAQIDDASVSFTKTIAACTVEEAAAGAQDSLVDRPLPVVAGDGKIRVFPTEVKSVTHVSTAHDGNFLHQMQLRGAESDN